MEIRPIREAEAEEFLRLMCDVFTLDLGRARAVFFREPFYDLNRKWAVFVGGRIVSILTTTPLEFGWGRAMGIAGVATVAEERGQGYAAQLIRRVVDHASATAEGPALLFAQRETIYARLGFELIDVVIRGHIVPEQPIAQAPAMPITLVKRLYEAWTEQDPNRLRRDDRRWKYWNWTFRHCEPLGRGYICDEANLVREAVVFDESDWSEAPASEWYGLQVVADAIGIPLRNARAELLVMGRGFKHPPQMFLTDQF